MRCSRSLSHLKSREGRRALLGQSGKLAFRVIRAVFLCAMCFVILYPILYMVSLSFRESRDLLDPTVIWIPKHWTLDNYRAVIETLKYGRLLTETVLISGISTVLNVGICSVIGYGFARFRFKGRALLFGLVIFTIIVPSQCIAIPLFVQYYSFDFLGLGQIGRLFTGAPFTVNLLNTHLTFYLPAAFGMGIRSGLFIYIFRQFFRGMPIELEDAAYIDGCGIFPTFLRIMAPNAGAAFISCVLFSLAWYWNDYYLGTLFFDQAPTLSVALGGSQSALLSMGTNAATDPYAMVSRLQAGCVLLILPMVLVFMLFQRRFTESVDKTGIVG